MAGDVAAYGYALHASTPQISLYKDQHRNDKEKLGKLWFLRTF